MSQMADAAETLAREWLIIRARLLDVAASLDRIARANGSVGDDPAMFRIRRSLELLAGFDPDSDESELAEQVQLIFSRPYRDDWQRELSAGE